MQSTLHKLAALLVGLVLLTTIKWSWFTGRAIRRDLRHYAKVVRESPISVPDKERLLDLTDGLDDRLRHGGSLSWFRWAEADDAIQPMLEDGITKDEVRLIERELQRVGKE